MVETLKYIHCKIGPKCTSQRTVVTRLGGEGAKPGVADALPCSGTAHFCLSASALRGKQEPRCSLHIKYNFSINSKVAYHYSRLSRDRGLCYLPWERPPSKGKITTEVAVESSNSGDPLR